MDKKAKDVYAKALDLLGSLGEEDEDAEVMDTVLNLSQVLYNYAAKRRSTEPTTSRSTQPTSVSEPELQEERQQQGAKEGATDSFDPSAEFERLVQSKSSRGSVSIGDDKPRSTEAEDEENPLLQEIDPKKNVKFVEANDLFPDVEGSAKENGSEALIASENVSSPQLKQPVKVIVIGAHLNTPTSEQSGSEAVEKLSRVKRKNNVADAQTSTPAKRICSDVCSSSEVDQCEPLNDSDCITVRMSGRKRKVTAKAREYMQHLGVKVEREDHEYNNPGSSQGENCATKDSPAKIGSSKQIEVIKHTGTSPRNLTKTLSRRGRPRKTPVYKEADSSSLSSSESEAETCVPKRGRGRPPKNRDNAGNTPTKTASVSALDHGHLRQGRSSIQDEVTQDSDSEDCAIVEETASNRMPSESTPQKRGRGRPRKIPQVDTEDSDPEYIPGPSTSPGQTVKRGRGRPPKTPQNAHAEDKAADPEEISEHQSGTVTPKRGRGRPRKTPKHNIPDELDDGIAIGEAEGENPAVETPVSPRPLKRGPGRPRKTPVAVDVSDNNGSPSVMSQECARGPGRPRKMPVRVDVSDNSGSPSVVSPECATPKRGRGRPRKDSLHVQVKDHTFAPMRKRGRPPKYLKEGSDMTSCKLKKRKPGRPRIYPSLEDTEEEYDETEDESQYEEEETADEENKLEEEEAEEGYQFFCLYCNSSKVTWNELTELPAESTFQRRIYMRNHVEEKHMRFTQDGFLFMDCLLCSYRPTSRRLQNKVLVNRMLNHMASIHHIPLMVSVKSILPPGSDLLQAKGSDVPVVVEEEGAKGPMQENIVIDDKGEIVGGKDEIKKAEEKEDVSTTVAPLPAMEQSWRYFCMLCHDSSAMTSSTALLTMTDGMPTLKALLEHIEMLHLQKSSGECHLKCPVCFLEYHGSSSEARDFPNQLIKHVTNMHNVVYFRSTQAQDLVEQTPATEHNEVKGEKSENTVSTKGTYYCILCSDDPIQPQIDLYRSSPFPNLVQLTTHILKVHVLFGDASSSIPCPVCPKYAQLHHEVPKALPMKFLNHLRSLHKVHCEKDRVGDRIIKKEETKKLMKFKDMTPVHRVVKKKMIKQKGDIGKKERTVFDSFHCIYCLEPGESVTTANVLKSRSFPKKSQLLRHIDSTHSTSSDNVSYLRCPICQTRMSDRDRLTQPSMRMVRHISATHNVFYSQHLGLDPWDNMDEDSPVDESELEKEEALMKEASDQRRVERRNLRAQARDELHDTYHCPYCTETEWFYTTLDIRYSQTSFNSRLELVTHMADHYTSDESGDQQHLSCPVCDRQAPRGAQSTPSGTRILKHMSTVHEILYSSRASQVPARLQFLNYDDEAEDCKITTMAEDVATAVDEKFTWFCIVCNDTKKVFPCRKGLMKHLEMCHVYMLRNDTLISCPRCDWGFGSSLDFRRADSIVAYNFVEHCLLSPGHTCREPRRDASADEAELPLEEALEESVKNVLNPGEQKAPNNQNHTCFLCHEGTYETQDEAIDHIFTSHLLVSPDFRSEYLRCASCPVRVLDPNPFSEEKTLQDKKLCTSHLLHHMVHEHSTAVPSYWEVYTCNICGYQTLKLDTYESHAQAMHDKTLTELAEQPPPRRPKNMQIIRRMVRRFNCFTCGAAFMRKHQLNSHIREKHERKNRSLCSACGKVCNDPYSYMNHSWKDHKLNVLNKPMVRCEECGEEMPNRLLRLHLKSHRTSHKRRQITCDICNKVIITMAEYKRHRATHGQTTFRCEICPFETDQPGYLPKHVAHVHKIGGHLCQYCNEMFMKEEFLESHIRRNHPDGQISNFCTLCQKKLCSRLSYENHMFKCHDVNVSRRSVTQCGLCGFRTLGNSLMKNHMLLHNAETSDYKCKECGCVFKTKDRYTTHMQIKHGEKAFKCNVCHFAFRTNSMLQRHIARLHTHEMVRCKDCTYQTYRLDLFEKHMKSVHGVGKQEEQELISQMIETDTEAFKRGNPMNIVEIDKKDKSMDGDLSSLLNAASEGVADIETVHHIVTPGNLPVQATISEGFQLVRTESPVTQHIVTSTGLQQVLHGVQIGSIEESTEIPLLQTLESTEAAESLQALASLPSAGGQQIFQMENGETFQLDDHQVMVQTSDGVGETVVIETYDNINIKCSPEEDGVQYFYLTMEEEQE